MSDKLVKDLGSDPQFLTLYDNFIPSLEADTYDINATVTIKTSSGDISSTATQKFSVTAPRFTLPSSEIHAMQPAPNTETTDTHLPHIVFQQAEFPWEREPRSGKSNVRLPWVVLMVFQEEELLYSPSDGPTFNPNTKTLTTPVGVFLTPDSAVLKPVIQPKPGESPESLLCQTIKIQKSLFRTIFPSFDEIAYLAHCRRSSDQSFSVVWSNRFPKAPPLGKPGIKNIAHLISLEGVESFFQDSSSISTVELISLYSWSFTCLPEPTQSFQQLATNLVNGAEFLKISAHLPHTSEIAKISTLPPIDSKIGGGFVPVLYSTHMGEKTIAWYRGPFSPIPINPINSAEIPNSQTGGHFVCYDPQNGLFDFSYASAWQLGRLLALSDTNFIQALLDYRAKFHSQQQLEKQQKRDSCLQDRDLFLQKLSKPFVPEMQKVTPNVKKNSNQFQLFLANPGGPKNSLNTDSSNSQNFESPADQGRDTVFRAPNFKENQDNTDILRAWITQLRQLIPVPFHFLVPDSRLLPPESLRFFHVDPNWIDQLVLGCLSLGLHCQGDIACTQKIRETCDGGSRVIPVFGLLIRSGIVSGWPGLLVKASKNNSPIELLRKEKLGPNVLLCLFAATPDQVIVSQPHEQLSFGVTGDGLSEGKNEGIILRNITGNIGSTFGKNLPLQDTGAYNRDTRVLKISSLVNELAKELGYPTLGPAAFGLQMIRTPEEIVFNFSPNSSIRF